MRPFLVCDVDFCGLVYTSLTIRGIPPNNCILLSLFALHQIGQKPPPKNSRKFQSHSRGTKYNDGRNGNHPEFSTADSTLERSKRWVSAHPSTFSGGRVVENITSRDSGNSNGLRRSSTAMENGQSENCNSWPRLKGSSVRNPNQDRRHYYANSQTYNFTSDEGKRLKPHRLSRRLMLSQIVFY